MTCLSFLAGLDVAASLIACGRYRNILLVSSEIASKGLNWRGDLETAGNFGDGAVALVLQPPAAGTGTVTLLAAAFETHHEGVGHCYIPGGGTRRHPAFIPGDYAALGYFHMSGREVFRLSSRVLPPFIDRLLASAGLRVADLDWVVPHQASRLGLDHIRKRLDIPAAKVVDIFDRYGNQIAASLPMALAALRQRADWRPGQKVMLVGTGAGLSLGGILLET